MGKGRDTRTFRRLAANLRAQQLPCYLCGQPIKYDVDQGHPESFTVDHKRSLIGHPHLAEDPANLVPAHRKCNSHKSTKTAAPLGATSENW